MARLDELGYLDDVGYARSLVARRAGGRGPALISAELAALGIDREVALAVLAELEPEQSLEAARRLAARMPDLDARRLAGRLQRRGFGSEIVRRLLAERDGHALGSPAGGPRPL